MSDESLSLQHKVTEKEPRKIILGWQVGVRAWKTMNTSLCCLYLNQKSVINFSLERNSNNML